VLTDSAGAPSFQCPASILSAMFKLIAIAVKEESELVQSNFLVTALKSVMTSIF